VSTAQHSELLDTILKYVTDDDWDEGFDLYQSGRVDNAVPGAGLIQSKVTDRTFAKLEVRIKVQTESKCIQWIECTCRKHRLSGRYCEHIAAVMLHIDREQSSLFASLDKKMPLKPPSIPKVRGVKTVEPTDDEASGPRNSKNRILTQMKGSILNVSLVSHGPKMRVKLEIKEGHVTQYDLELDDAADFLQGKPPTSALSEEARKLKIWAEPAFLATIVTQDDECVTLRRAVCIPYSSKMTLKKQEVEMLRAFFPDGTQRNAREYVVLQLKNTARHLGNRYAFLPELGYWSIDRGLCSDQWWETPLKQEYEGDAAVDFLTTAFAGLAKHSPLFTDDNVEVPEILRVSKLSSIKLQSFKDGWFHLDPKYGEGNAAVSMAALIKAYRKTGRSYFKQGKNWVAVPDIVKELNWQVDEDSDEVKIDNLGLIRLQAMAGDFDAFVGSKTLLEKIRSSVDPSTSKNVPNLSSTTKLTLRPYQDEGLSWLWWLYSSGLHGLLADEMGLGKTHQAMALMSAVQSEQKDAKFLVLCPTTVLDHWLDKVNNFCPNLQPIKYHGPKRLTELQHIENRGGLLITSYGVVLRDVRYFEKINWHTVILDEAHAIKNSDTSTYKAVCKLRGQLRLCMSGTPIENNLQELKSIFDFLVPGYLGSDQYFRKQFVRNADAENPVEQEVALQRLIHPLKLRRIKANVLSDLPEKIEDIRRVSLEEEQVALYRGVIEAKARPLVQQLANDESPIPYLHVFATLTLLKQICDHPALVLPGENWRKHTSGKFELLKELLEESIGSGHKIVIFSQYVSMIKIIDDYLTETGIQHVTMTGQSRNRGKLIEDFQTDPNCKVFLGSLLAGGTGIDLTSASVVVHYDRWWNASKENQATDRVHRIGQTKNVQVLKLITNGTLEEKIDAMIKAKQHLFEKFMDRDEEMFKQFSRQELISLLE